MRGPQIDPPPPRRWLAALAILLVLGMFALAISYRFTGDFTGLFKYGTSGRSRTSE